MLFKILAIPAILAASTSAAAIKHFENFDIPAACGVCDAFGIGCVAACVAGGPLDPICDICAGPAIGTCLSCLSQN